MVAQCVLTVHHVPLHANNCRAAISVWINRVTLIKTLRPVTFYLLSQEWADCIVRKYTIFVGVFSELRKAAVRFVLSVCLSVPVRKERRASHRTELNEIWYLRIFRKSLKKTPKFHYNQTRIRSTLHEDLCTFISRQLFLEWEMFHVKVFNEIWYLSIFRKSLKKTPSSITIRQE